MKTAPAWAPGPPLSAAAFDQRFPVSLENVIYRHLPVRQQAAGRPLLRPGGEDHRQRLSGTIQQLSRAPGQRASPPGCHGAIIGRTRRLSSPSPTGTTVTSTEILQGTGERHVGTVPLDGAGIQGARTPMPRRRKARIKSRGQAQSAPGVAPVLAFAQAPRQECPRAAVSQSSVDAERCRKANPHDTQDRPPCFMSQPCPVESTCPPRKLGADS